MLLLFVIGLEIRPLRLWALRREVFGLGSLQIILTASAITGYALLNHWPWKASLVIGLTMAVSSTALVMQSAGPWRDSEPHGGAAFGVLLMQDLAIVPMLALIPMLAGPGAFSMSIPGWKQFGSYWVFSSWYGDSAGTLYLSLWNGWRARKTGRVF